MKTLILTMTLIATCWWLWCMTEGLLDGGDVILWLLSGQLGIPTVHGRRRDINDVLNSTRFPIPVIHIRVTVNKPMLELLSWCKRLVLRCCGASVGANRSQTPTPGR